jgi:hypothetical protein
MHFRGKAPFPGPSAVGAPRFELGTSSPPDCLGQWRAVSGSGAKWLRYVVSGHSLACLSRPVLGRLGTDWARRPLTRSKRTMTLECLAVSGNWARLTIGSNVVENTPGIIVADGRALVFLERGDDSQQLLVTADVYDVTGAHVAKLRRNAWAFNDQDRFAFTTNPTSLTLTEEASGEVVLEANVHDRNRIEVPRGRLYTPTGTAIAIAPDRLVVGGITMMQNTASGLGTFLEISPGRLAIGGGKPPAPDDWLV